MIYNRRDKRGKDMLKGVRVVEIGSFITAPLAGMMLGDLGADVIKVERPEGDPFRGARGGQYSPHFTAINRNKRSVVLDLGSEPDRVTLLKLIEKSDVLLDNLRPGALTKYGLGPAALASRNPRLIQCSITGFGAVGPYRDRPVFDAVGQALSGISSLTIDPESPVSSGPTISDDVTGMYACYAILGALYERERTGRGRRLEVNMLEASMAFIRGSFVNFMQRGLVGDRFTRVATSQSFIFACADGKLLAVHLSTGEAFWKSLANTLEAGELAGDPRFARHAERAKNYPVLRDLLAKRFLLRSRPEWMVRLEQADVPFAPVYQVDEALADPQVVASGIVCELTHPTQGRVRSIHCPVLIDGKRPESDMRAPPTLGEHSEEIKISIEGSVATTA
jgi:crotonobetainyl-CoA:carnitine CoA-transferase CaiB-like acyl-CoA transferase